MQNIFISLKLFESNRIDCIGKLNCNPVQKEYVHRGRFTLINQSHMEMCTTRYGVVVHMLC